MIEMALSIIIAISTVYGLLRLLVALDNLTKPPRDGIA